MSVFVVVCVKMRPKSLGSDLSTSMLPSSSQRVFAQWQSSLPSLFVLEQEQVLQVPLPPQAP